MKSIRRDITFRMLIGFAVLLAFSGEAIYVLTRVALLREFDAGLRARALTIMSLTEQSSGAIHVELAPDFFPSADRNAAADFFELWETNGALCVRSESLAGADLPKQFGSLDKPAYWDLLLPGNGSGRAIGIEFMPKPEDEDGKKGLTVGKAILVVAGNLRAIDRTTQTLAFVLFAVGLLMLGVTVPMVRLALKRGHAPLDELGRRAAMITADSLQTRFAMDSLPEELQPIAGRLNDLLSRLEDSFARERRFSADLAHELRTPLAELRAHAEVELAWAQGPESEKHRETLNIALQMEAMVTRLLELARSENGALPVQLETVPLALLVSEIWQPLEAKAKTKQLSVNVAIPVDATLQADRALLRSILANLLSNAVEYTPLGGRVEISWHKDSGELTVSNSTGDFSAEDVSHLFERLWRKDNSRTGTEHCGLGLALSREFARSMNLDLTAGLDDKNVLTFILRSRSR